jgi:hypothetical protein
MRVGISLNPGQSTQVAEFLPPERPKTPALVEDAAALPPEPLKAQASILPKEQAKRPHSKGHRKVHAKGGTDAKTVTPRRQSDPDSSMPQKTESSSNGAFEEGAILNVAPSKMPNPASIQALGEAVTDEIEASMEQSTASTDSLKKHANDVRKMVAAQWKEIRSQSQKGASDSPEDSQDLTENMQEHANDGKQTATQNSGFMGGLRSRFSGKAKDTKDKEQEEPVKKDTKSKQKGQSAASVIPQNFDDMAEFNAMMIGANVALIRMILKEFDGLVASFVSRDEASLEKDCRVIALRIHREITGAVNLREFQVCMLASLRAQLPKSWDTQCERNWADMWGSVQECLQPKLALPGKYAKPVTTFTADIDAATQRQIGLAVFQQLFKLMPESEMYFKQSNDRLCFIVEQAFRFSTNLLQEPGKTADEATALGLKHIMFGVATKYFDPFVACCIEVAQTYTDDAVALEGLAWSMETVAAIMVHTIETGSTPLLRAVLANNPKQVRKELGAMPKGKRAKAALGTL